MESSKLLSSLTIDDDQSLGFHIGNGETGIIDSTTQRYNKQKLPINKFRLVVPNFENALVSSLNRWLYIAINNTHLRELHLHIASQSSSTYNIPNSIFVAKKLTRLLIHGVAHYEYSVSIGCGGFDSHRLTFELPSLRTLRLFMVKIKPCLLQELISNCPNIETLSLSTLVSPGLKKLEVHGLERIKKLSIRYCNELVYVSINNAQNLETVSITGRIRTQVDTGYAPKLKGVSYSSE